MTVRSDMVDITEVLIMFRILHYLKGWYNYDTNRSCRNKAPYQFIQWRW